MGRVTQVAQIQPTARLHSRTPHRGRPVEARAYIVQTPGSPMASSVPNVTSEHHQVQHLREELQASQALSANVELTAQMRDAQNRAHIVHTEQ